MKLRMKSMPHAILQVIASGALSAFAMHPAIAQTSGDAAAPQRVVVTGSLISRADKETPSPVQVLTADDLAKSGLTTSPKCCATCRQRPGRPGHRFRRRVRQRRRRRLAARPDRGLDPGPDRRPPHGSVPAVGRCPAPFVDVSAIPFDAVERIEVLKDGASSVYGSDAIAGVINIILKKSINGTNVKADIGDSQHGGGQNAPSVDHPRLRRSGDDGYNAFGSPGMRHSDAIKVIDRDNKHWANGDWAARDATAPT